MITLILGSALVLVTGALLYVSKQVRWYSKTLRRHMDINSKLDEENAKLVQSLMTQSTQLQGTVLAMNAVIATRQCKCEVCLKVLTADDFVVDALDGRPHTRCMAHAPSEPDPFDGYVEGVIDMDALFGPDRERIDPDDNQ